jgi:uracil-DNA glycosylase family 4
MRVSQWSVRPVRFSWAVLEEAGLSRRDVLLLNRVRCRPPGNKINSKEGIAALAACDPWLQAELELYDPSVVLLMGGTAIGEVFGKKASVGKVRGSARTSGADYAYGARTWVATAHPAATLYGDGGKEHWLPLIYQDVLTAKGLVEVR